MTVTAVPALQACTGEEVAVDLEVTGGEGPYQWFATSLAPELVLEQNGEGHAALRGTLRDVGSFDVTLGVRDARGCAQLSIPVSVAQTPVILAVWPSACAGAPFELTLAAEGGDPATYDWSYEGMAPLEGDGSTLIGSAPDEPGKYPVRLTLRDAQCPSPGVEPVRLDDVWSVRSPGDCPSIVTRELPAPCEGIPYSQALVASDGSGSGYVWSALRSQLPSGLQLDTERGVIRGTPTGETRTGFLELLVEDSLGQLATTRLELTLRDQCRVLWIADEPARLHVGDVFLTTEALVLPRGVEPEASVLDMKLSPDGTRLAFRAGATGAERLYVDSMADTATAADGRVDFACPTPAACDVLDYAWSRDSRHLAVALGAGSPQDFVSGVSLAAGSPPEIWPVVGTGLANGTEVLLDYVRDLSWATGDLFGFVGASGQDGPPQTVFVAQAGLAAPPRSAPYYDADLRLRQTPAGWVAFDAFYYTATALVPPNGVTLHSVAWASPSGDYVGSIREGQLSIYAMTDAAAPLAATPLGACAVVATWAPAANGIERIVCSGGSLDAPDGTALRIFDFDVTRRTFDPPTGREVPLNGSFTPSPLTNTRRFFAPSADWLVVGAPEQGVSVLSVPRGSPGLPRTTSDLPVTAPAELRFSPDGHSLLRYDRDGLLWQPIPLSPFQSTLSIDEAGLRVAPPNLTTCEEALWASPDNWCGAPASLGHFVISADSKSVLFEADQRVWIADLGLTHERPARRVAPLAASCGSSCAEHSYGFAP